MGFGGRPCRATVELLCSLAKKSPAPILYESEPVRLTDLPDFLSLCPPGRSALAYSPSSIRSHPCGSADLGDQVEISSLPAKAGKLKTSVQCTTGGRHPTRVLSIVLSFPAPGKTVR